MMPLTITLYDLAEPDDRAAFDQAHRAPDLEAAVHDHLEWLRSQVKHDVIDADIRSFLYDQRDLVTAGRVLEYTRKHLLEQLANHGVELP